jgi:hypothetical protein
MSQEAGPSRHSPSQSHSPSASLALDDTNRVEETSNSGEGFVGDETIGMFPLVTSFRGPLLSENLIPTGDGRDSFQLIDMPTFQPLRWMRQGSALAFRREECIKSGMVGLGRPNLLYLDLASRRLQETVFKVEFQELEALLTKVIRGEMDIYDSSGISSVRITVYRFYSAKFQVLMAQLYFRRGLAAEGFRLKGKPLPTFPVIGLDGNVDEWYNENDFEIIGVCFRVEVENFLGLTLTGAYLVDYRSFPNMLQSPHLNCIW